MIRLFHKHKFKVTQRTYMILYSNKWIIYDIHYCKCGAYKLIKCCGTIELDDIPIEFVTKVIKNAKHRIN